MAWSQDDITVPEVGFHLHDFEQGHTELIKGFMLDGINVWPVIKTHIYFKFFFNNSTITNVERTSWAQKLKKGVAAVQSLDSLKKSLRGKVLILASEADDRIVEEKGLNDFLDWFAIDGKLNYLYVARSAYQKSIRTVKIDAYSDLAINWYYRSNGLPNNVVERIEEISQEAFQVLQQSFQEKFSKYYFSKDSIKNALILYAKEYFIWDYLFQNGAPKYIITSEQFGTGLAGAAKKNSIPLLDMQHGLVGKYDAAYNYTASLVPLKAVLPLPTQLGLFDNFHKDILTQLGFWQPSELKIFGSERLDRERIKLQDKLKPNTILIIQQGAFDAECYELVANASLLGNHGPVLLKLHPLDPEGIELHYQTLLADRPWLSIAKQQNIYELLAQAKVVISFHSTVLFEAVALNIPTISLACESLPQGIYTIMSEKVVEKAIPVYWYKDIKSVADYIQALDSKTPYSSPFQNYFFTEGFKKNLKSFIQNDPTLRSCVAS